MRARLVDAVVDDRHDVGVLDGRAHGRLAQEAGAALLGVAASPSPARAATLHGHVRAVARAAASYTEPIAPPPSLRVTV